MSPLLDEETTYDPVQVRAVQVRTSLKCSPSVKITLLLISAQKNENTGAILAVHPVPTPSQPVRPFRTGSGTVQAGDSRTGRGLSGLFLLPFFIDSSLLFSLSLLVVSLAITEKLGRVIFSCSALAQGFPFSFFSCRARAPARVVSLAIDKDYARVLCFRVLGFFRVFPLLFFSRARAPFFYRVSEYDYVSSPGRGDHIGLTLSRSYFANAEIFQVLSAFAVQLLRLKCPVALFADLSRKGNRLLAYTLGRENHCAGVAAHSAKQFWYTPVRQTTSPLQGPDPDETPDESEEAILKSASSIGKFESPVVDLIPLKQDKQDLAGLIVGGSSAIYAVTK